MAFYQGYPGHLDYCREICKDDPFEMAVVRSLGEVIRTYDGIAEEVWCALTNTVWIHKNGDIAAYSFRAAGGLIAAIRQEGSYINWSCCSSQSGTVSHQVSELLGMEGWTHSAMNATLIDMLVTEIRKDNKMTTSA